VFYRLTGYNRTMKHFHAYDICGEIVCVDADYYQVLNSDALRFYNEAGDTIALFNWSNVVCVREEADDDDDDDDVPSTPVPDYLQGVLN
jgi:hypothetical protein